VRISAISSLGQNPDDKSTDTLLRLTRDSDPQVRAAALQTLGQVGSERAQNAIFEAARTRLQGVASSRIRHVSRATNVRARVTTSARRWRTQGILRTIFLMWRLRLAYFLGADPAHLARQYGYADR
jgi:HEAT repeat protein